MESKWSVSIGLLFLKSNNLTQNEGFGNTKYFTPFWHNEVLQRSERSCEKNLLLFHSFHPFVYLSNQIHLCALATKSISNFSWTTKIEFLNFVRYL